MSEHSTQASDPHLEVHEVVAYLEGRLTSEARARVELHLSNCEDCSAEIAGVWQLRVRRAARSRWFTIGAAGAAAAVIALVVLGPPHPLPVPSGRDVERGPAQAQTIAVVNPAEGAVLTGRPVLRWRGIPGASSYWVRVAREDGDSVWAANTSDTTAAIPPTVALTRPGRYFWYVDALLPDGTSFSSGLHEFTVAP